MCKTFNGSWPVALATLILVTGCGRDEGPAAPAPGGLAEPVERSEATYRLSAEPAGAKGVIEVRKAAQDGDEVIVVGHIAGGEKPLIEGRAAFTVVDLSLEPCEDDKPWVYCCTPREELIAAMVMVKFVDDDGKTLTLDARQLLGVKEWDTVVVRGQARRDTEGNLTAIIAQGLYVRP